MLSRLSKDLPRPCNENITDTYPFGIFFPIWTVGLVRDEKGFRYGSHVFVARIATNFGDVPTWISAITSLFALVGAGIAAWQAFRIYRLESERDRRAQAAQEDRDRHSRRSQASLVSAWW